ncbi:M14 family metallopeptidase [Sphingomonas sp. PL-96]|uniref:M14 family metallopeptidase n=1 Tax=Sphingomonas sp. PL-96 TaxID=2887201 RepID=UPI001E3705BD|nr:M14 metallopeptidase family protein [Sphingomonas sp. PL-96]MCC2977059.1 M14 family metallopeptidase [Sphingomonas sp. PL-96]
MRGLLLATTILAIVAAGPAQAQLAPPTTAQITDPKDVIGGVPGSDYFLANYTSITAWLQKVAAESDRIKLVSIGKTTEGREQWMVVVSSPENIRNLDQHRDVARRLALAKGLSDESARALARQGKAMVWIDAGVHATETVNGQAHIQIIHDLLTGNDPETLRLLNDDIALFVFANPDGLELVANWYMRPTDIKARKVDTIPVLYHHYVGHDDNRDSFAVTQAETTNINKAMFRDWFPQLAYNQHQTGPEGTVVFIPPFRDPLNYNNEPLVINMTNGLAYAMHGRLLAEGKPGSVMRSGAPYSTWFNGNLRTIANFHNVPGILTEIIGSPTPMEIPLVPKHQIAREDLAAPIAPQPWHFQQSIDYVRSLDRAMLDYASRNRETVLYNRYIMGRDQIANGSRDSWIVTPKRIEALEAAAKQEAAPGDTRLAEGAGGEDSATVPSKLFDTVLHDPAKRMPRAYVLPADAQRDMPTTVAFLNTLIKNGVEVQQANAAFAVGSATYPAGSYIVRADQAFRPHILDMFEPQDHPHDFAYPGGPPVRPYDITGYTLALQMGVKFDRLLDTAPPEMPAVPDLIASPPAGHVIGTGNAGYVVSHATNNSFRLTNRLLKAKAPVSWISAPVTVEGRTLPPGTLWIPASARSKAIVEAAVASLGIDAYKVAAKPEGASVALRPVRIGLVDVYGGSMASGWTRWIFEQFEFPYKRVYPQELDRGNLKGKYDVLVFQSDVFGREGGRRRKLPDAKDIPAEFRPMLGQLTDEKTVPQLASFARAGGTVIAVGNATTLGAKLGLGVTNQLAEQKDGKSVPLPSSKFYVPGSILSAQFDPSNPIAYGMPATADVFYYNNPTYALAQGDANLRRVAWFASDDPLRSGWAWGQKTLNGTTAIVDATLGKGHVYLLGPEVTQRAQPYSTFKLLFNSVLYGPTQTAAK